MELREYAREILLARSLKEKLRPPPEGMSDADPGDPVRSAEPGRPPDLAIVPSSRAKVPPVKGIADPAQKVRILHAFANHELQAVELFAWAVLAFPDAPAAFRRGLIRILAEEQAHCRLYLDRMGELGAAFGDNPVSGYFWSKVDGLTTPARFVSAMALTFESANLDHAVEYADAAERHRDRKTAEIIRRVHDDEVGHVKFGWHWLGRFREPGQSMNDAYLANVDWPLRPFLAKGPVFHPESRIEAGMDEAFVQMIADAERGDGPPRIE